MSYEIGDTVVHGVHGLGTVVAIDEMKLAGITQMYYVVAVKISKFWVPVKDANEGSIRIPTARLEFNRLFDILRTHGEELSENQFQRKTELRARMQKWTPEELCHVIRDLTDRSRHHTLNMDDSSVLFRAEQHLLDEWVYSLGTERSKALGELQGLLQEDQPELKDR
jgi:RNA polymerase-interacting CarD/CdnL/TRCF family regulator